MMFRLILSLLSAFYLAVSITAASAAPADLITKKSNHEVKVTVERLQKAIEARGARVMAVVDHANGAAGVDLKLRPTTLIIFGNPKLGTLFMQSNQTAGLDLPQRILVWQDANGAAMVGYWAPVLLAKTHGITDRDDAVTSMSKALDAITEEAVKP